MLLHLPTVCTGQSARMAWKWGGGKGKAGVPENEDDYYRRHMSRYVNIGRGSVNAYMFMFWMRNVQWMKYWRRTVGICSRRKKLLCDVVCSYTFVFTENRRHQKKLKKMVISVTTTIRRKGKRKREMLEGRMKTTMTSKRKRKKGGRGMHLVALCITHYNRLRHTAGVTTFTQYMSKTIVLIGITQVFPRLQSKKCWLYLGS